MADEVVDETPIEAENVPDLPEIEPEESGGVTADDVAKILGKGKVDTTNVAVPEVNEKEEVADEVTQPETDESTAAKPPDNKPDDTKRPEPAKLDDAKSTEETPDFTVQVEDAGGTTHKIERIEDLPEDFEPKNNRQIMEILRDLSIKESDKAAYESDQATTKAEADKQERVTAIQTGWDEEVKALQADKRIPVTTDPNKNERVEQIYKFMGEENSRRETRGLPPLVTIEDVLDKLEKQEDVAAKAKAATEAKETARKNGGLVGGSSAAATSSTPVYRGGAKNAIQALKMMGTL